ncbi:protein translation factor SUI1 homolog isoform X1 [Solanum dulcamara]|uniref:protein translation factor SUI1 homolog isoform X1 n=1 Tax=Solanum dulcamara TaxID=45834 RepID=UPI0024851589|nr:protein translation factor SUI1 homolog isoform X1 [Solanum dulcamara]
MVLVHEAQLFLVLNRHNPKPEGFFRIYIETKTIFSVHFTPLYFLRLIRIPIGFSLFISQNPKFSDPFAEANADNSGAGTKDYVHIRIQQRNGRKSLTTVQGLKKEFSYNKILKDLKKEFCCNGTVVQDPELGQVIQLQGDQRKNVSTFLVQAGIVKKEHIKIHGF